MTHASHLIAGAAWLVLGCGTDGTGPAGGDARRFATQFDRLADSVAGGGDALTAEALRHAAEIVRLTGHATPVSLTIDGARRSFLAVAEQLDFPTLVCTWPVDSGIVAPPDTPSAPPPPDSTGATPPSGGGGTPGDSGVVGPRPRPPGPPEPPTCEVSGTHSMRALTAWEPGTMAEVVRIVADVGSNPVVPGVPDVMTGLPGATGTVEGAPPTAPPDSAGGGSGGGPGFPGFLGEYLERERGSWWASEGNQANGLESASGECSEERTTIDWAEFDCEAARLRFEFSMTVEPLRYERLTGTAGAPGAGESHRLAMASSAIDGVRLTWRAWIPPPLPPVPEPRPVPAPVDSSAGS